MSLKVPSREQLKKFLPDHESIVQFEKLFGSSSSIEQLVTNIIESAGLNSSDGTYIVSTLAHYINVATDLFNADTILDQKIYELAQRIVTITTNYTALVGNYSIIADATSGAITITLPLANTATSFIIGITKKDISANSVTITRSGSDLICGSISQTLLYENEVLNFISDGTNWQLAN